MTNSAHTRRREARSLGCFLFFFQEAVRLVMWCGDSGEIVVVGFRKRKRRTGSARGGERCWR